MSADGKLLLTAGFTAVEVWDFEKGKRLRELEEVPETKLPPYKIDEKFGPWLTYTVSSLSISPDGKKAAAAYARTNTECSVYLWDTGTGKKLPGWPGEKKFKAPLVFSADGKFLAAVQDRGESDCHVVLWDLAKEQIVARFAVADIACGCVAFSSDGKLLAIVGLTRASCRYLRSKRERDCAVATARATDLVDFLFRLRHVDHRR